MKRHKHRSYFQKKYIILCVAVIALFGVCFFALNNKPNRVTIVLTEKGFVPEQVTIKKGGTVTFKTRLNKEFWPASNIHPTHTIYPEFDPKRALKPTETWSFTFQRTGDFRFHDHLSPNNTGVVSVVGVGQKIQSDADLLASQCENIALSAKPKCWDDLLSVTAKKKGFDEAFQLFVKLYNTDPTVPKACHGWAHILGKTAFDEYQSTKKINLRKEVSYCGYGFFHGFIERLLQTTQDPKMVKQFCINASKQLGEQAPGTYTNCIHGIGHGSVDVDTVANYGDFQRMINPGLKKCELLLQDPGDLRNCFDGAFNAMQQYTYKGDYKLVLNREDLFKICRNQEERHKPSCYYEFTGLISDVTHNDFAKAAGMILRENLSDAENNTVFWKLSADFMQDDIVNPDQLKNVVQCRVLPQKVKGACFDGVVGGFLAHGAPGKEHIKALAFCAKDYLTEDERIECYQITLGQLATRNSPICKSVDSKYQKYCRI